MRNTSVQSLSAHVQSTFAPGAHGSAAQRKNVSMSCTASTTHTAPPVQLRPPPQAVHCVSHFGPSAIQTPFEHVARDLDFT